jgi:hypothetical protein
MTAKKETIGKEILVRRTTWAYAWQEAKKGSVWYLFLHGAQYSASLRSAPPRVRLLEDSQPSTRCELVDPWPDAPPEWPPPEKGAEP